MEINNKKWNLKYFIFLGGFIFYISYIIYIYWNIPFFDTMFDFLWLPEKFHEGTLSLGDFRFHYGEHGMMGYSLLYLLNTLFFNLSMRFEILLNTILVILNGIVACIIYCKTLEKRNFLFYIGFALIVLVMFSPTQGFHSGMSIQIRLGITLAFITLFYSEKIYQSEKSSISSYILLYVLLVLSYIVFGTFYTFSWIAAIIFIYTSRMIYEKVKKVQNRNDAYYIEIAIMFICVVVYFLFYRPSIGNQLSKNNENVFVFILNLFKFITVSMGSATLPWDAVADGHLSKNILLLNSLFITIITFIALLLYCITKMWKKTLVPPIMILYSVFTFIQIYLGRADSNIFHSYNSWYNVHTKYMLTAVIWIYFYTVVDSNRIDIKSNILKPIIVQGISGFLIAIAITLFFIGFIIFSNRVPYLKAWYDRKIPYLIGEYALTSDENGSTELLVPYDKAMQGIEILRKYKLNVFRYGNIANTLQPYVRYSGFHDKEINGNWIEGNASIIIENNSTATRFFLKGYYPENWPENYITVTINENESTTSVLVPGNTFMVELDFINNLQTISIDLKTEKSFIPRDEGWNEDNRELGAFITHWSL